MYSNMMLLAIKNGDVDKMKELVTSRKDRIQDEIEFAVKQAALFGHLNVMTYLVEECHYDLTQDSFALVISLAHKHDTLSSYLIRKGAKINHVTNSNSRQDSLLLVTA